MTNDLHRLGDSEVYCLAALAWSMKLIDTGPG